MDRGADPRECMTKPPNPRPVSSPRAPAGSKPRTPIERTRKGAPLARQPRSDASEAKMHPNRHQGGKGDGPSIADSHNLPSQSGAQVSRRAADRLRGGHLWVYASDIEAIEIPEAGTASPALLAVADSRGLLLGTALYSPTSQIALRLGARLRTAIRRRKSMLSEDTNACRLCFSEADELPGLIADKYGDLVILQLLAKGLDSPQVRDICVRVLRDELSPASILERPDPRVRELEGLSAPDAGPLFLAEGPAHGFAGPQATRFRINGLQFEYDAGSGQKTGAFLDQRDNYAAAQRWAQTLGAAKWAGGGRALDVCCYQGGFALHLAQACRQVTGIDASRASLEVAERNVASNRGRIHAEVDWVEGDAFQILRDWSSSGEKFNAIVLDPPAFAKSRRAVEGALRGYKELNLRALKMLDPGGLLVTCSCSHHVSWADLESAVAMAAADAGRRVRLLERRGAALDHPVVLNLPETEYLKCLLLEVE